MTEKFMVCNQGTGYRLLSIGEKIQEGDEVHPENEKWRPINKGLIGEEIHNPEEFSRGVPAEGQPPRPSPGLPTVWQELPRREELPSKTARYPRFPPGPR